MKIKGLRNKSLIIVYMFEHLVYNYPFVTRYIFWNHRKQS